MTWKNIATEFESEPPKQGPMLGLPPCVKCKKDDGYVPSNKHGQTHNYLIDDDDQPFRASNPGKETLNMFTTLAYCGNCYESTDSAKGYHYVGFDSQEGHYGLASYMLQKLRIRARQDQVKNFWNKLDKAEE